MEKIRKIAFLTKDDPLDKRSWSGIYFRMFNALQTQFDEVIPLGPIKIPAIEYIAKIFQYLTWIILRKRYNRSHSILLSKACSITIKRKLRKNNFDAIFAPASSSLIAYLKTDIPVFYYSDTTLNLMINYYDTFSNLPNFSIIESNLIEKKAILNARASIFASDWAAHDAVSTYNSKPENTFVIKMGANIDYAPQEINFEKKLKQKTCNLLFLGVDWKRKGGDIVFETFKLLLEKGFETQLVVCGCIPPIEHPQMTVYPFLNKNIETDYKIFTLLLEDAHFLFLPARAECAGIVFCEAAANGFPSITTDTGGVTSYVENQVSGFCLPYDTSPEEYAELISNTFSDKELYTKLSKQSRKKYFDELNWEVWAKSIFNLIQKSI
jgi:glycosyltransferase involved in cell wall biosynthesis